MTFNPFRIPMDETWCNDVACPHCEKKYGLHSDTYTDGRIDYCGNCGWIGKCKSEDTWL